MSRSTGWSGVVGGEVAWRAAEAVVEGDCCGEGEELGGEAGAQGVELAGAVVFEAEHVLGGPEDALDPHWRIGARCGAAGLVCGAVRTISAPSARPGDGCWRPWREVLLELAAGVALVGDDREERRCA